MSSEQTPSQKLTPLVLGAIVLVFVVWMGWTWMNWGKPGHGVDDSPQAATPTRGAAPGATPRADAGQPAGGAVRAMPNNSGEDSTGDAARGDRTVETNKSDQTQEPR